MQVLHINCNYIGTALHQSMIENLDARGIENSVFVPTYDRKLSAIRPNSNVLICECFKKWDRVLFDYKQRKIFNALESNFKIPDYDLIHAYTLFTDGNCARRMAQKYGKPYVVAVRNTDVNNFFRLMPHLRKRGVQIMRDAAAVFFLSESYRDQVFSKYVPPKYQEALSAKTYIVPNGIDNFWFANEQAPKIVLDGTVKLIFAGRIDRNKNIQTTQKAMEILRNRGVAVMLTVVGRVADQRLLNKIKNDPYTKFVSAMPKEELITLYRNHDIFVMPSYTESFGLVYAEAMSQGLPVIYSKGQGFDNQFPEGIVGYHVDAHDAVDVADGIENAINHFDSIQQNVVELSKRFNWTDITAVYARIYKELT